jgi:aspartate/methionine/tyrosine aminotransferase
MNPLATELNDQLKGTVARRLLSDFGKRFYFPKGLAAQAAEAQGKATRHDASTGMALDQGGPMMPESMEKLTAPLTRSEAVRYAPGGGVGELRQIWAEEMVRKNPGLKGVNLSHPMVVAGLTNGVFQVSDLFTDPGDYVVLPDMHWDNYRLIFAERQKAEIVTYPFFSKEGGFNTAGLAKSLEGMEKAIVVLNFPNNPTGYSPTRIEAKEIAAVLGTAAGNGTAILAICDDAYFGLFYEDDTYPESLFSLLASFHENLLAVKVDGPTKEEFTWGFRIGFVTFGSKGLESIHYDALNQKLLGSIRSSVSSCSRPAQSLLIRALKEPGYSEQKLALFRELKARYGEAKRIIAEGGCEPLMPLPFNSGYFMVFSFPGKAEKLRVKLLNEFGIGTISIREDFLRVVFAAVERDELASLYAKIASAAADLQE